jgi:hypothetical protein
MKKVALVTALAITIAILFVGTAIAAPTAVGAEKCKPCHPTQYSSWAASKHAAAKVECETCHGPGSDYKAMPVMKDPARSKAAGLIAKPAKASCTAKCHKTGFKDDMLAKVHEHKKK